MGSQGTRPARAAKLLARIISRKPKYGQNRGIVLGTYARKGDILVSCVELNLVFGRYSRRDLTRCVLPTQMCLSIPYIYRMGETLLSIRHRFHCTATIVAIEIFNFAIFQTSS